MSKESEIQIGESLKEGSEEKDKFVEYYEEQSTSDETINRFESIFHLIQRVLAQNHRSDSYKHVGDVGCGAGTQSIMWSQKGFIVHGLDVNSALIELAKKRASDVGEDIEFLQGTATQLPWENRSMDICLVPELIEHVQDWMSCINEFTRILKPGGILFLSTNNKLCPIQQEFDLPLYSWYPKRLKKHYEKLAVTTRPELVSHTKYPAVNWFTYFGLRSELLKREFQCLDRFDVMNLENLSSFSRFVAKLIKRSSLIRWFAHVATPYTLVVAVKRN